MKALSSLIGRNKSIKSENKNLGDSSPQPSSPAQQNAGSPIDKRKSLGSIFGKNSPATPKAPEVNSIVKLGTLTKEGEKVKVCKRFLF